MRSSGVRVPHLALNPNHQILNINQKQKSMSKFTNQGIRATLTHYMDATAHGLTDEHTEEDLVNDISKQCGVNPEIWKIDRHRITGNAWTVNGKFGS